jgi:imidazolonepropionase-like amidohydrolase
MTDYSTLEELEQMAKAGMGYRDILASLTTAPAARRGQAASSGKIAVGFDADLVALRTDPSQGASAFADVKYTIRGSRIIFE